jgi:hypothetical protein
MMLRTSCGFDCSETPIIGTSRSICSQQRVRRSLAGAVVPRNEHETDRTSLGM